MVEGSAFNVASSLRKPTPKGLASSDTASPFFLLGGATAFGVGWACLKGKHLKWGEGVSNWSKGFVSKAVSHAMGLSQMSGLSVFPSPSHSLTCELNGNLPAKH